MRLQEAEGVDCGDEAAEWVSKHLNKPGARLLRFTETQSERTLRQTEKIFKEQNVELPQEDPKVQQIAIVGKGVLDTGVSLYVQIVCSCRSFLSYSNWLSTHQGLLWDS